MPYPLELKLRRVLSGCSSCSKTFEGLPERKPTNTKTMVPGKCYECLDRPREPLGLEPAHSTADSFLMCPFPRTPMLASAVHSITLCLGCQGLIRKYV